MHLVDKNRVAVDDQTVLCTQALQIEKMGENWNWKTGRPSLGKIVPGVVLSGFSDYSLETNIAFSNDNSPQYNCHTPSSPILMLWIHTQYEILTFLA
jgi:predicted acyl esterase